MEHHVEFNEETQSMGKFRSRKLIGDPVVPPIVRNLVKWGIVKDYDSAGIFVVFFALACLGVAAGVYVFIVPHPPSARDELPHDVSRAL